MITPLLTPVSVFDDALAKATAAARAMLPLLAETLHVQFPTGAWLVLVRPPDYADDDLRLDSIRTADGEILREFDPHGRAPDRLPAVPDRIAALWGVHLDPRDPEEVLGLVQRIDDVDRYTFLRPLPEGALRPGEANVERMPLGVAIGPVACVDHGERCAPDGNLPPAEPCTDPRHTGALRERFGCVGPDPGPAVAAGVPAEAAGGPRCLVCETPLDEHVGKVCPLP